MGALGRRAFVGGAALVAAAALAAAELLAWTGPGSNHPGIVSRWYVEHGDVLGWRALLLAVAAIAVVAFAMSFRELTWAAIPGRAWTGTLTVLAALGYAGITSYAAAVDMSISRSLVWSPSPDLLAMNAELYHSLLVVATPAMVVVLLGSTLPVAARSTFGWRAAALLAVACAGLLAVPASWEVARRLLPLWFLVVGLTALRSVPGITRQAVEPLAGPDDVPQDGDGGLAVRRWT